MDVSPNSSKTTLTQPGVISKKHISSRPSLEKIQTSPITTIQLRIEEIPPMEVFYSPYHKAILNKSRKKRKVVDT